MDSLKLKIMYNLKYNEESLSKKKKCTFCCTIITVVDVIDFFFINYHFAENAGRTKLGREGGYVRGKKGGID